MEGCFDYLTRLERVPENLVKGLQLIQATEGYVADAAIRAAAEYFGRSAADVEGIVKFYPQFRRMRPARCSIAVCDGNSCRAKGADGVREWLFRELGLRPGASTPDGVFSLESVPCLGRCALAPAIRINGRIYGKMERSALKKILREYTRDPGEK